MENANSMSEKILRSLEQILTTDSALKEFWIVPTENNMKNKSPILYEEHNIGLESWCIKHVYKYACMELFTKRKLLARKKLSHTKMRELNHLLMGALLINPDVTTFWNMRRELVECDVFTVQNELFFSKVVLSYKSKSNESFAYRKWLLKRTALSTSDLEGEFEVTESAAERASNNYHAWTHRIWCLENCRDLNLSQVIQSELEFSQGWVATHVSEHSGFHYRQYLFNLVEKSDFNSVIERYYREITERLDLNTENDPRNFLVFLLGKHKEKSVEETAKFVNHLSLLFFDLFCVLQKLNLLFPGHESLWYHRRFLLYSLINTAYKFHDLAPKTHLNINDSLLGSDLNIVDYDLFREGEKEPKLFKTQPNKVESSRLYEILVKNERRFIGLNSVDNEIQMKLAKKYEKWLRFVVCFEGV